MQAALDRAVEGWAAKWLHQPPLLTTQIARGASAAGAGDWISIGTSGAPTCARIPDEGYRAILDAMIASSEPTGALLGSVAKALVHRAVASLACGLVREGATEQAVVVEPCPAPPAATRPVRNSDAVVATIAIGDARLDLLLAREHIDAALGLSKPPDPVTVSRRALVRRSEVVTGGRVALEVTLGDAALPVSEIRGLRKSDVIMFDQQIGQPLRIRIRAGENVGVCFLGRKDQQRAVRVIKDEGTSL